MMPLGKAGSSHDTVTESFPEPMKLGLPTGPATGRSDGKISIDII